MDIKKLDEGIQISDDAIVKVTEMGNIVKVSYMSKQNTEATIKMLGDGKYMVLKTGEVKECEKHDSRADQYKSLHRTFDRLRALINTNVDDVTKCHWITLTYAENMQDTKRLYQDFKKFNQRFQYYIQREFGFKAEYISVCEPQGRGAWHIHLLYIYPKKRPFIPNVKLRDLWGFGWVKIGDLKNCDNVGAYLTAYLGDLELTDETNSLFGKYKPKIVEVDEDGKPVKKAFLKGARLPLYPVGFNIYRTSKGIKEPTIYKTFNSEAEKKVSAGTLTYSAVYKITDDDFDAVISNSYYNLKRSKNQS